MLVTGAGGGIGARILDRFLANGDRVISMDRAKFSLEALAASCNAGDELSTSYVDITDKSALESFAEHVRQKDNHVYVLVNCAWFYPVVPFEQMRQEQRLEVIAINLTGTFRFTRTLLPLMKGRGWGRIVNIRSGPVFEGIVGQSHYVSVKTWIVGFTRSLAMEAGGYGITINIVAHGLTLTVPVLNNMPNELIEAEGELRAIKRDEQPRDLAGPVFLLYSLHADFVSGEMLVADGEKIKALNLY